MCSNYRPVTRSDRLLTFFGVERAKDEPPVDTCPALHRLRVLDQDGSPQWIILADQGPEEFTEVANQLLRKFCAQSKIEEHQIAFRRHSEISRMKVAMEQSRSKDHCEEQTCCSASNEILIRGLSVVTLTKPFDQLKEKVRFTGGVPKAAVIPVAMVARRTGEKPDSGVSLASDFE